MKKHLKAARFLLLLLAVFLLLDAMLCFWGENFAYRAVNDYEVTRRNHPEEVWDRVFFGNSTVIAAYREDLSESGYVNLGMDYAVVTDLWQLLEQGHVKVGSELVIGLNLFTLYDSFETNPSYIWHRKFYEPYAYFHRDKLFGELKIMAKQLLNMDTSALQGSKILYYGNLSDAQLEERMATYWENYYNLPLSEFEQNIQALGKIADWCEEAGVRLRIIWMPNNPSTELPELLTQLQEQVSLLCEDRAIPVLDCTDLLDETCFHDVGHLNYEYGACLFTKEVDQWLIN